MRFDCGKRNSYQKHMLRLRALHWWHKWYAWFPVRVGPHDCRWLETVERRGERWVSWGGSGWTWEYRA